MEQPTPEQISRAAKEAGMEWTPEQASLAAKEWLTPEQVKQISQVVSHDFPWGHINVVVTNDPTLGDGVPVPGHPRRRGRPSDLSMITTALGSALVGLRPPGMSVAKAVETVAEWHDLEERTLAQFYAGRIGGAQRFRLKRRDAYTSFGWNRR
jgi:hypothetical protein